MRNTGPFPRPPHDHSVPRSLHPSWSYSISSFTTSVTAMAIDDAKQYERKLTRRILWKLDIHVLPSLAFVRASFLCCLITQR